MLTWLKEAAANDTAVICPTSGIWTYAKLAGLSSSIARQLREYGVVPGDRVVICAQKSAQYVAAIFGIVGCGAAYVPIFERTPTDRARAIIDDCEPRLVLADSTGKEVLSGLGHLVALDFEDDGQGPAADEANDEERCYLLYTSGSTGTPKGVMVPNRSVQHFASWGRDYFDMSNRSVLLSTAPFNFDMSVFDLFATVRAGGAIVLATDKHCMFPKMLLSLIENHAVTHWKGVSSLLQYLAQVNAIDPARLQSLQHVVFSGEKIPEKYLRQWMTELPDIQYYNAYGPTEATGVSICHRIKRQPANGEVVPIGRPRAGTIVRILREDQSDCATFEVGQIAISGLGLALGYWNDRAKTNRSFVEIDGERTYLTGDLGFVDEDAVVHFRDRADRQVKVQGYRIELGDVSGSVMNIDGIEDAAAVVIRNRNDVTEIALAVSITRQIEVLELRKLMSSVLPKYMVPKHVRIVEAIPRSDRGKVDFKAVTEMFLAK